MDKKKIKCKYCTSTFDEFKELTYHVKASHKKEWKSYTEHMNEWKFWNQSSLQEGCHVCPHKENKGF